MEQSTRTPAVAQAPAVSLTCDFFTDRPDGSEWLIAFRGTAPTEMPDALDGPTAAALHELLEGVTDELEMLDPGGCDSADVEVIEPVRGRDCAIRVRSSYVSMSCALLGMVLKRLRDAGCVINHTDYWPDVPQEVIDARDAAYLLEHPEADREAPAV